MKRKLMIEINADKSCEFCEYLDECEERCLLFDAPIDPGTEACEWPRLPACLAAERAARPQPDATLQVLTEIVAELRHLYAVPLTPEGTAAKLASLIRKGEAMTDGQARPQPDAGLVEVLREARLQIEYLHGKFQETGSGNAVLARIEAAARKEQD